MIVRPVIVAETPESTTNATPSRVPTAIVKRLAPGPSIVIVGDPVVISTGDPELTERDRLGRVEERLLEADRIGSPGQVGLLDRPAQRAIRGDVVGDRIERTGDGERC